MWRWPAKIFTLWVIWFTLVCALSLHPVIIITSLLAMLYKTFWLAIYLYASLVPDY